MHCILFTIQSCAETNGRWRTLCRRDVALVSSLLMAGNWTPFHKVLDSRREAEDWLKRKDLAVQYSNDDNYRYSPECDM